MAHELTRFEAPDLSFAGLSLWTPDISPELTLTLNTKNVTHGLRRGLGPRYGFSPIPRHNETSVVVSEDPGGLQQAEGSLTSLKNREKIFNIFPITLATFEDRAVYKTFFVHVLSQEKSGSARHMLDYSISSTKTGNTSTYVTFVHASDIAGLLPESIPQIDLDKTISNVPILSWYPFCSLFYDGRSTMDAGDASNIPFAKSLYSAFAVTNATNYVSSDVISVSGKNVPMKNYAGRVVTPGDATNTPIPNLSGQYYLGGAAFHAMGCPSYFVSRAINTKIKSISFIAINAELNGGALGFQRKYTYTGLWTPTQFVNTANQSASGNSFSNLSSVGTATIENRLLGAVPNMDYATHVLVTDEEGVTNSSYYAILSAPSRAVACVIQDWHGNVDGTLNQYVDLASFPIEPPKYRTQGRGTSVPITNVQYYPCSFRDFQSFSPSIPLQQDSSFALAKTISQIRLGAANSGILRKNTVYELTYSIYHKRIDYESNVGAPAVFLTGTDDFVALTIYCDTTIAGTYVQNQLYDFEFGTRTGVIDYPLSLTGPSDYNNLGIGINYLEYRFYYRQKGAFEWLPCGSIDAAKYYFDPTMNRQYICAGPVVGTVGGQPGGFNDYSKIPEDNYNCVVSWKKRAFWLSSKNLVFSLRDNIFAYPLRNSVPCPTGEFRGAVIHSYPGQADQDSRLVVFGSRETYVGKFTGNFIQGSVQVSPDTIGQFPLDGSDFVLNYWTSATAFSSRAACVADGVLYFWGPKGVWRDGGVDLPEKISGDLEPDLFDLYVPEKTNEIFSYYNDQTKEIIWCYNPQSDPLKTHALLYSTKTGEFLRLEFNCKVDNIQSLTIENTLIARGVNGSRAMAVVRPNSSSAAQRAYFFDYRNRSGDYKPGNELLIKTVSSIDSRTRRLTIAEGSVMPASILPGDKICLSQVLTYTGQGFDVETVVVSSTATTIDVLLPVGSEAWIPSVSLTSALYFPAYHDRSHSILWQIETTYWNPSGMRFWGWWLYSHVSFKLDLLPATSAPTFTFEHRTPISASFVGRTVTLSNNSDGQFQAYVSLNPQDQGFEGQAIKTRLSGAHLSGEWVLQYLSFDVNPQSADQLMTFEG